jgi:hypothetical protein
MSWSLVQASGVQNTNGSGVTSISKSFTPNAVGDLLVVAVGYYSSFATAPTISDTVNTYTLQGFETGPVASNRIALWTATAASTAALTITVTIPNGFPSLAVAEFSPGGGTISLDGSPSANNGTGTAVTAGSITTTATDLAIGATVLAGSTAVTPGSGYTSAYYGNNNGTADGVSLIYNLSAAPTSVNPAWTFGTSEQWAALGVCFKSVAAGGLFTGCPMDGLGAGGPFFSNPLGRM